VEYSFTVESNLYQPLSSAVTSAAKQARKRQAIPAMAIAGRISFQPVVKSNIKEVHYAKPNNEKVETGQEAVQ
jgi:hypothetical protein